MAGAGYKLFNTGDVLTAAQVNTYLMEQTVMVFDDAAARTTALTGVVSEGMISYLKDTNATEIYDGSAWISVGGSASPLTTKGDLYTYSTADARLAVGSNGDTLVADSAATTGLRWQGNFAAGKNKIINGDFGIWQRGTSFSTFGYTADRWSYGWGGGTGVTGTISRQAFTAGTAPVAGYEGTYFLRHNITNTGGATSVEIETRLEDVRLFAGQTVTLSAWMKADAARTFRFDVVQDFGSGGSSAVTTSGVSQTLTTGWVRYTQVINVPSISGKTIGTNSNLRFRFRIDADTYTIDIWGCQLEAGSVATAFQTATGTLAGELAACQRYYWRANVTSGAYLSFAVGQNYSTTQALIHIPNPVAMRTGAASVDYSNLGLTNSGATPQALTAFTLNHTGPLGNALAGTVASGLVAGNATILSANNSTAAYVAFSAEL